MSVQLNSKSPAFTMSGCIESNNYGVDFTPYSIELFRVDNDVLVMYIKCTVTLTS